MTRQMAAKGKKDVGPEATVTGVQKPRISKTREKKTAKGAKGRSLGEQSAENSVATEPGPSRARNTRAKCSAPGMVRTRAALAKQKKDAELSGLDEQRAENTVANPGPMSPNNEQPTSTNSVIQAASANGTNQTKEQKAENTVAKTGPMPPNNEQTTSTNSIIQAVAANGTNQTREQKAENTVANPGPMSPNNEQPTSTNSIKHAAAASNGTNQTKEQKAENTVTSSGPAPTVSTVNLTPQTKDAALKCLDEENAENAAVSTKQKPLLSIRTLPPLVSITNARAANLAKQPVKKTARVSSAHLRIQKDMSSLELPPGCECVHPDIDDLLKFMVHIVPSEGPYRYKNTTFEFNVGKGYPCEPPKVKCVTKIFHPNIDEAGNVCLNILREDWKPVLDIRCIVFGLYLLLITPNAKDPLNKEAGLLMINNPFEFEKKIWQYGSD